MRDRRGRRAICPLEATARTRQQAAFTRKQISRSRSSHSSSTAERLGMWDYSPLACVFRPLVFSPEHTHVGNNYFSRSAVVVESCWRWWEMEHKEGSRSSRQGSDFGQALSSSGTPWGHAHTRALSASPRLLASDERAFKGREPGRELEEQQPSSKKHITYIMHGKKSSSCDNSWAIFEELAGSSSIHCNVERSTESDTSHLALPVRAPVLHHVDPTVPDDDDRVEGPGVHARNRRCLIFFFLTRNGHHHYCRQQGGRQQDEHGHSGIHHDVDER